MNLFKKTSNSAEAPGRRRPERAELERRQSPAFSYHAQRSSPAENIGRTTDHIVPQGENADLSYGRTVRQTFGVTAALGLVVYLSLIIGQPSLVLNASGSDAFFLQDASIYQRSVRDSVDGSVLNANKVTLDTGSIERNLLQSYPEIASVQVQKSFLMPTFSVHVTPQKPALILTTSDNRAFLVDTNGRALISTSRITDSGELAVPTLQDTSGLAIQTGKQALPRGVVSFTESVAAAFEAKGIIIDSLSLPRAASQLDVGIEGAPYYIKFNLQEDALQQIGTYLAVRQRLQKERVVPAIYIDVRVSERAYYK